MSHQEIFTWNSRNNNTGSFRENIKRISYCSSVKYKWHIMKCPRKYMLKVKQSLNMPGQALRVTGSWGSQISRKSAYDGGKVINPTHRPPLSPRKYSCYSFLLEAESTPGTWWGRKDYVMEKFQWHHRETTFRLVSQCLQQLRYRVNQYKR